MLNFKRPILKIDLKIVHVRLLLLWQYAIQLIFFFILLQSGNQILMNYIVLLLLVFFSILIFSRKLVRLFSYTSSLSIDQDGLKLKMNWKKNSTIFSFYWQKIKSISIFSYKRYFYLCLTLHGDHRIKIVIDEMEFARNQKVLESVIDCLEKNISEYNNRHELSEQIAIVPSSTIFNKKRTLFYRYFVPLLLLLLFYFLFELNIYLVIIFPVGFILLLLLFQKAYFVVSDKPLDFNS